MAGSEPIAFGLAVWRASKMATEEEGPFLIFTRLRDAAGAERNGIPADWNEMSTIGKLFQCPYCISVWIALVLLLSKRINRRFYMILMMSLFGSAVTALIEDYYASNDHP